MLKFILLEDSPLDVELLLRQLKKGPWELQYALAESKSEFQQKLENEVWDVVISDYNIPGFGAESALSVIQSLKLDLPMIVVSGAVGEETAVEMIKAGVTDFIMKSNLHRLVPAIKRCKTEVQLRAKEKEARHLAIEAIKAKEKMLSIVSHDIKTPITTIELTVQLIDSMIERKLPLTDEVLSGHLKRISHASEQVVKLIDDVLDMTRIESGTFKIERAKTNIDELIDKAIQTMLPIALDKSVILTNHVDTAQSEFSLDESRILEALNNLINNAIKFTPKNGKINLSVSSHGQGLCFSVEDTGVGIEEKDLKNLFDCYWQGSKSNKGSIGLGLTIVKAIVEAHDGHLEVQSKFGEGSTFKFTLPNTAA